MNASSDGRSTCEASEKPRGTLFISGRPFLPNPPALPTVERLDFQILVFPTPHINLSWNNGTPKNANYHLKQKTMPKRNFVQIQLPPEQPDCCAECPLLGLVPGYVQRPKNSKETHVCCATREALTQRGSKVRASQRDVNHPLHRPCDNYWHAWMLLPGRKYGITTQIYNDCRRPYENTLQLQIKFHK